MDRTDRHRASAGRPGGVAALLALLMLLCSAETAAARQVFGPAGAANIPRERLFDIGVADPDGDGLLDLFTTNHKFHAGLLHNNGDGNFTDVTGPSGLSPTPQFPGYETLHPPQLDKSGVYVYATDPKREKKPGQIHIRSVNVPASGSISFGADSATVMKTDRVAVQQSRTAAGQPIIYFRIEPGGSLDIQPSHLDLPLSVSFDPPPQTAPDPILPPVVDPPPQTDPDPILPPVARAGSERAGPGQPIYVGADAVPAPRDFVLSLPDRHGIAFADLLGDGATDAVVISGGLGGVIKLPGYREKIQDELLVDDDGRFNDAAAGSGLVKDGCRGRQVSAVDINKDGNVDLFETCEGDPPNAFLQGPRGKFRRIDGPAAIGTTYRWANLRGGPSPSLLAAERKGTRVLSLKKGEWRSRQLIRDNARNGQVAQYALDDVDNDGDLDVLAVSRSGNTLLINRRGELSRKSLRGTGIPSRSVAASFVDYDNDGRIDVDLVPQGLMRGVAPLRFKRTGKLRTEPAGAGITNWFDYDNDGLRDPVTATANAVFAKRMKVTRARNLGPGGHWLEVDLLGPGGNKEAVGARVTVRSGGQRYYGWVGESDDSHHSQGHYRIYFGLGGDAVVDRVAVRWPNGNRQQLRKLRADQVLRIEYH